MCPRNERKFPFHFHLSHKVLNIRPQDSVAAKRNMTKYGNQDVTFTSTREAKFVNALIEAVEAGDAEAFTSAVYEYDQITKLDNWKTSILLKIKKTIGEDMSFT